MTMEQFRERIRGRDINDESNLSSYCTWVERFLEWQGGDRISEGDLRDFDSALENPSTLHFTNRTDPYAHSTRIYALSAVKKWAEVMQDVEIRTDVNDLVRGSPVPFRPTILDRSDVHELLNEPCDIRGCLAARNVGHDAIMRGAEVMDARPQDVDPEAGTIYVRAKKNSDPREIGVAPETTALLMEHIDFVKDRFVRPTKLFYTKSMTMGMSPNAWTQHFRRVHHEAGFHSFARHTAIVHRLEDGEDFYDVFLRARHKHVSMTARYASIAGRTVPSKVQNA